MTIYDQYTTRDGYTVAIIDGYNVRMINPHGVAIKTANKSIKADPKWKSFQLLKKSHASKITSAKHELTRMMMARKVVSVSYFCESWSKRGVIFDAGDFLGVAGGMYVTAWSLGGTEITGFITGINNDNQILVDRKPVESIKMLHPLEIPNLQEIQIKAIKERRLQNIMQLFRPEYKPNDKEEYHVVRFREIPIDVYKFSKIIETYGWRIPRGKERSGIIEKTFEGDKINYRVLFEFSLDEVKSDRTCEVGEAEFQIVYGEDIRNIVKDGRTVEIRNAVEAQPCRCFDVDPVVFSEAVWEMDKTISTCRMDDKLSSEMTFQRQTVTSMFIAALGLKNCEIIGNVVKIYGDWGTYGVSLVNARAFWWVDKMFICIQPKGKGLAFLASDTLLNEDEEGVVEDPTLSLAISKINQLSHDSNPVDKVVRDQIEPLRPGFSRKGEPLIRVVNGE